MHQRNVEPVGGGINSHKIKNGLSRFCHPGLDPGSRPINLDSRFRGNDKNRGEIFEEIISLENLFSAWSEFSYGKKKKLDVLEFKMNLEDNLFGLHYELKDKTYRHSYYTAFSINDPKPRKIHKACVRDRVLHHAIFRVLYLIFDKSFIFDSYSCRIEKGTHRAVSRLEKFAGKLSQNNTKNIFALKCDIRKFFDSIDQDILLELLKRKIKDKDALWLIELIIESFEKSPGKGLPLGNVTSQLFANIYLNELDQFVKHDLREKYYLRYCDDFIILGKSKEYLAELIPLIASFLKGELKLMLHPDKIIVRKYHQGVDFLGFVALPDYRVLRTKTKNRILKKIKVNCENKKSGLISKRYFYQSLQSYLGILTHCEGRKIIGEFRKIIKNELTGFSLSPA